MTGDRRAEDKRIEDIAGMVKEIRDILQAENGVCVRLSVAERSIEATQKELSDHKSVGFRVVDIVLAAGVFVVGILEWLRGGK